MHRERTKLASWVLVVVIALFAGIPAQGQAAYPGTIQIAVDASQAQQKLFHATLAIPVKAGPLTLLYPQWIPGEHGPSGPITELTGLKFTAGGKPVEWRRDDVNMYAIHVVVPAGASELQVALDYTSPVEMPRGYTGGTTATAQMAVLSWNWMLLYPQGYAAEQIQYWASLRLPPGWQFGTALPIEAESGGKIQFKLASLYTLVDSPVIAGRFFRTVQLTADGVKPKVVMHLASDGAAAIDVPPVVEQKFKQLVAETTGLFGATHYREYHFLLSLSDHVAHFGLEHHESNDSRSRERSLIDPRQLMLMAGLLPHEFVHSWNGKYRRPAGLNTRDYEQPMKGELLWVYEGLTTYLGEILTARSGLVSAEQYRDRLTETAAGMEYRSGRTWRPLLDTAVSAPMRGPRGNWSNWRRGLDYYPEGELLWLEADVKIRQLTGGKKSLDDFCKLFFGAPALAEGQVPAVNPYTFDDLVKALNEVAPYNWRGFWDEKLNSTSVHAPLGGVEGSGWKLTFSDKPSGLMRAREGSAKTSDLTYSLGMSIGREDGGSGVVNDVVFGMPVAKAGIMPGMKIVAVNSRAWSPEVMRDALNAARNNPEPLELLVQNVEYFSTYKVDYHGGMRYPHLEPNGSPDVLADIIRQHAASVQ